MITKRLFEKAQKIVVKKVEETPTRVFVHMVYVDRTGRHEGIVDLDLTVEPDITNIKDILWCECLYCSTYNMNTKDLCALKIRAIKELTQRKIIKSDIWNAILDEVRE